MKATELKKRGRPKKVKDLEPISEPKKRGRPAKIKEEPKKRGPKLKVNNKKVIEKKKLSNKKIDFKSIPPIKGEYDIWTLDTEWCKMYLEDKVLLELLEKSLNIKVESEYFDGKKLKPFAWTINFGRNELKIVQTICKKVKFENEIKKECKSKSKVISKK